MDQDASTGLEKRNVWLRGLLMILMGLAHQLAGTVLLFTAILQFISTLVTDAPNPRLAAFGRSLGRFQSQIADFASFASEVVPFPFTDWPAGD